MKKILACLILIISISNLAHAEKIKFLTAENEEVIFEISRGMPLPAKNDWVEITSAGFNYYTGNMKEKSATLSWAFGFKIKHNNIKKVQVYEVDKDSVELLLEDINIVTTGNEWSKLGQPILITKDKFPWLYDKKLSTLIFKFVIQDEAGENRTLYQAAAYPGSFDKKIAKFLKR